MKRIAFGAGVFLALALLPVFPDLFHPLNLVKSEGATLAERIDTPFGFTRVPAEKGSFPEYIRNVPLKPAKSPVLLHGGREKQNQNAHCAVFSLPVESDAQEAAGSVARLYAEYMRKAGLDKKIAFRFENGSLCRWTDWQKNAGARRGTNTSVAGGLKKWTRYEKPVDQDETFRTYLRAVTASVSVLSVQMFESEPTTFSALRIGDLLLDGGGPAFLCLVADICESETGERAVLLAQGGTPAQEFHIIKNPKRINDPWYHEDDFITPCETPEHTFPKESWRRANYLD